MNLDTAERWNLGIAGGALATSVALASPHFVASLALGTLMEIANYRALRRSAERFLGNPTSGRAWGAGFGARFTLLSLAVGLALWAGANPVGLLLGLSTIVPALLIAGWRWTPPELPPDATALGPDAPEWDDWNAWTAQERTATGDEDEA